MANKFDSCGLKPAANAEAQELIKHFNDFYDPGDLRKDLTPYGIYISKEFLQTILNQMGDAQNCVHLRLGLTEKPALFDKKISLVWMLRTIQAVDTTTDQSFSNEGHWYVSDFPADQGSPTEPVVMKDPNH